MDFDRIPAVNKLTFKLTVYVLRSCEDRHNKYFIAGVYGNEQITVLCSAIIVPVLPVCFTSHIYTENDHDKFEQQMRKILCRIDNCGGGNGVERGSERALRYSRWPSGGNGENGLGKA